MSEQDDLGGRLDAVEADVERLKQATADLDELREDVAGTRQLAALADRDVGEVHAAHRAQLGLLTALNETQREQGRAIQHLAHLVGGLAVGQQRLEARLDTLAAGQARHDKVLARHDEAFARHDEAFARHDEAFARHDEAFARHDGAFARHDGAFARHDEALADIATMVRRLVDRA